MGPYPDNIFFLWNPVNADVHKAADNNSEKKYGCKEKYCPEHSMFVPFKMVFVTVGLVDWRGKAGNCTIMNQLED